MLVILPLSLAACEVGLDQPLTKPEVEEVPAPPPVVAPPPSAARLLCASSGDAPRRIVLALTDARSLTLVRADGTRLPAPVQVPVAEGEPHYYRLLSRGDFIAVTAGGSSDSRSVTAMLDRQGELLWQHEHASAVVLPVALSARGELIISRYHTEANRSDHVVYTPAGGSYVLNDFRPMGPPGADGWVPGVRVTDEQPGWQKEQGFRALGTPFEQLSLHRYGDGFMFLAEGITVPWLMFEDMQHNDQVLLWELEGVQASDIRVEQWQEPWLLIQDQASERYYRIHVQTGAAELLEQRLPEGMRPLDALACQPRPHLTSEGRVVMQARDDASMQVLSALPGEEWGALGRPLTTVEQVDVHESAGTFAIVGLHQETFCPPMDWEPSEEAVAGRSFQLVRPEADTSWLLPEGAQWVTMDERGLCAVYWSGGEAKVMDVVTGVESGIGSAGGMIWLD